ncbi:MAG: hypothetical protein IPI49_03975 [Myxococcales bacterium]|nr:hypothetical protein [Myxococcales bacterium]
MTRTPHVMAFLASLATGLASAPLAAVAQAGKAPVETPIPKVVERSRLDVAPSQTPFLNLSVDNPLGDVRIEGHDGSSVMIETHKSAPDDSTMDRLRVSLVPGLDGSLRLGTAVDPGVDSRSVAKSAMRIDLVIRAPRDLRFTARVGSGQLEVSGMDAGGEADATSGPISLRNISGAVNARSISGPVTLTEIFGSIDAELVDAALRLDTVAGDSLVASAHRGAISGRRVRARRIELMTTSGDVELEGELALRGKLLISSLHGNITVRVRGRGQLSVRARGKQVDLGTTKTKLVKGVTLAELGSGDDRSSVDLRSRHGAIAFAVNW